jgi:pyrimidine and pyridine-specific 5'-nucleotidase
MRTARISDPSRILFVDDSRVNVLAACAVGWGRCVHFCEWGLAAMEGGRSKQIGSDIQKEKGELPAVSDLQQLRNVWSDIFKQTV